VSIGKARQGQAQASGCWIRKDARLAIYIRDGFACAYCGRSLKDAAPADITLDHLLPRSAGGSNDATNLVTACRSCNSSRQDKPWVDYATGGARDRIEQLRHSPLNRALAKALIAGTAGDATLEAAR
jgi:5-methylcytosine-specific restriction endonuclease McrA